VKRHRLLLCLLLVVGLVAAACGRDDDETGQEQESTDTTSAADEACDGVTLEATDIGVTEDTITIQVMADTGSPLRPGLFQGNVDAINGFADYINENGGIGCRELVVEEWDSKLTPDEGKNGQINACNSALAAVGGNSLFNPDVSELQTCPDQEGNPIGYPNISALANDINEQCALNSFIIQGIAETCNDDGSPPTGQRDLTAFVGNIQYYQTIEPDLVGLYLVPGDLPTTVQSATYQIEAQAQEGVEWVGTVKVSGRDEQSAYTPRVQLARNENANYVYGGSDSTTFTNMRREAAAQGLDNIAVWACSLACYNDDFRAASADVQDTYVWMQFLPFEEEGSNDELDNYLSHVDVPDSFGAQAWMAGVLFQDAVNQIVEDEGPNAITRQKMLDVLNGIDSFDANGWMGSKDPKGGFSDCMVILKMGPDGFERQTPSEEGTLDCDPSYLITTNLDPAVEAEKIQ